jgi:hypothetical protein
VFSGSWHLQAFFSLDSIESNVVVTFFCLCGMKVFGLVIVQFFRLFLLRPELQS